MNNKTAFVTGVTGQDGALLAKELLNHGYTVYGGFRRGSSNKTWRMDYLGITKNINLVEFQLNEPQNLIESLQRIKPDELYNLAAESFVADSFKYPGVTLEANTHGIVNILDAVRLVSPETHVFNASSSEVYGHGSNKLPLNEESDLQPKNPYAISKVAAQHFVNMYKEYYDLFACSGILFNHESPLRGREYVTRKITYNIARLKVAGGESFKLGNLDASRDWGAAEDYVKAMHKMLNIDKPRDFVIATGRLATVRDFLTYAAEAAGFNPKFEGTGLQEKCIDQKSGKVIAEVSEKYFRKQETPAMFGDASNIIAMTDWQGSRQLETLVDEMVSVDIDRWKKGIINV